MTGGSIEAPRLRRYAAFGAVGLANTLTSYLLYVVLELFLSYQLAYAIAFAAGVAISAIGNASWVFGSRLTWKAGLRFGAGYLFSYACGAALLHLFVARWHLAAWAGPLLVIALMAPVNYALAKLALVPSAKRDSSVLGSKESTS